jgi:hypothetical protein
MEFKDITPNFYQDSNQKPFCECTFCVKNLHESNEPYLIEKSFKRNRESKQLLTVIEYAICLECTIKKTQAISEESRQNIEKYMRENVLNSEGNLPRRNFVEKLEFCAATGKNVEDLDEFNLVGQFIGDKMLLSEFPVIMSNEISEEIQGLLSEKTKEEFDKFMDTITGVPPELKELFKTKRPVLI